MWVSNYGSYWQNTCWRCQWNVKFCIAVDYLMPLKIPEILSLWKWNLKYTYICCHRFEIFDAVLGWCSTRPHNLIHILPADCLTMCFKVYQYFSRYIKLFQGISRYINVYQGISRYINVFQSISRFSRYIKIQVNRPDQAMCELEGRNNERAQLVRRPTTSQLLLTYADTLGCMPTPWEPSSSSAHLTLTLMRSFE